MTWQPIETVPLNEWVHAKAAANGRYERIMFYQRPSGMPGPRGPAYDHKWWRPIPDPHFKRPMTYGEVEAVIIGLEKYAMEYVPHAPFCLQDALAILRDLRSEVFGFPEDQIKST